MIYIKRFYADPRRKSREIPKLKPDQIGHKDPEPDVDLEKFYREKSMEDKRFCTKCGKEFAEETKFCGECGTKVEGGGTGDAPILWGEGKGWWERNGKGVKGVCIFGGIVLLFPAIPFQVFWVPIALVLAIYWLVKSKG